MKGWFAAAVALSGLLLAWLLASMDSCGRVYEIDARGRLVEGVAAAQTTAPAGPERPALRWDATFPRFAGVAPRVRPGDRLDETTTTAGFPLFSLSMSCLQVTRGGEVVLTARAGAARFWGAIVGLCASPLFAWGVVAFWLAVAPSRPRPPPG